MAKEKQRRQHDVFISYSHRDAKSASDLAKRLASEGLSVWWDRKIAAGENWEAEIKKGLSSSKKVIALVSQSYLDSEFAKKEAALAAAEDKLIPVALDKDLAIPEYLRTSGSESVESGHPATSDSRVEHLLDQIGSTGGTSESSKPLVQNRGYAFISHVAEDLGFVADISGFLKKRGYAYWTYHESDRDYQKPTHLEIEERLSDCALMLSILSLQWRKSDWTFRELHFAREILKPIFLLRFQHPGPTLAIAGDTYIDFERDKVDGFRRLGIELDKKGL